MPDATAENQAPQDVQPNTGIPAQSVYVCQKNPNMKVRICDDPEEYVQFTDAHFRTDNAKVIAKLDAIMAKSPHVSQLIRKVDFAAALQIVREHRAKHHEQNKSILGGTTGAGMSMERMKAVSDEMRNTLVASGVNPENVDAVVAAFRAETTGAAVAHVDFDKIKAMEAQITKEHPPTQQPVPSATLNPMGTDQSLSQSIATASGNKATQGFKMPQMPQAGAGNIAPKKD